MKRGPAGPIGIWLCAAAALGTWASACANGTIHAQRPTGLEALEVSKVEPQIWLPGTRVLVTGRSFVDASLAQPTLRLKGKLGSRDIDVQLGNEIKYVDLAHLAFIAPPDLFGGQTGPFDGQAVLTFNSTANGKDYSAAPLHVALDVEKELAPTMRSMASPAYVNDPITVTGGGFLLGNGDGGQEGSTVAVLTGCFAPLGQSTCTPIPQVEITAAPASPFDRTATVFPYATRISGIGPGSFTGHVAIKNVHASGSVRMFQGMDVGWTIAPPILATADPGSASLGQYVFFRGGGFIGKRRDDPSTDGEETELHVDQGTFTPDGGMPVDLTNAFLIPSYQDGRTVKYIINETDKLDSVRGPTPGTIASGQFTGTVTPILTKPGAAKVTGRSAAISLTIVSVKQVVWVHFTDDYAYSLLWFGMRAADAQLRERIMAIAKRDYNGLNMEFRADPPTDFSERGFATVDINGTDPTNSGGLFGLDNTPGKDVDNLRLFDHVGGYYAKSQLDSFTGYGGVFIEEMLGFSQHPAGQKQVPTPSSLFDSIFDPFRPDVGGLPIVDADLDGFEPLRDGSSCPASDRAGQVACAIWVMGSMIGTTMTHEVGHSLGLANPDVADGDYHDYGDRPNRLMDAGGARTFEERSELMGQGPSMFCTEEYTYLRRILPARTPASTLARPSCNPP